MDAARYAACRSWNPFSTVTGISRPAGGDLSRRLFCSPGRYEATPMCPGARVGGHRRDARRQRHRKLRNGTTGFFSNYFELRNAREQTTSCRTEVDRLRLENQFLKNDLASAQRAEALAGFQARTPSKMIGARVIGATPGVGTNSVLIDRGTTSGVRRGMAVVTPDGIVGRVVAVFPFASQVLSVTDPGFAAGVESQKNHVHGVLKGVGSGSARVDYVPTGQKIEVGEMLFTSGEDRIFPRGLPVGKGNRSPRRRKLSGYHVEPAAAQEAARRKCWSFWIRCIRRFPTRAPADVPVFLAPA